jgi:hypothetical protein
MVLYIHMYTNVRKEQFGELAIHTHTENTLIGGGIGELAIHTHTENTLIGGGIGELATHTHTHE